MFSSSKMFDSSDICKLRSCHIRPSEESTFSSSPNVEILIAVLAQSFEHTSRSVPVQRAVFRDFLFRPTSRHLHFPGHQGQELLEICSAVAVSIHQIGHVLRLRSCRVLTEGPHDNTQFLGGHRAVSTLSQILCTTRVHDLDKRVLNMPTFSQMPPTMAVSHAHSSDEAKPVAPYSCVSAHDESIPRNLVL